MLVQAEFTPAFHPCPGVESPVIAGPSDKGFPQPLALKLLCAGVTQNTLDFLPVTEMIFGIRI